MANAPPQENLSVNVGEMRDVYFAAQKIYARPELRLLSNEQVAEYVDECQWRFKKRLPAMFKLLTSRETTPQYFDTIVRNQVTTTRLQTGDVDPVEEEELLESMRKDVEKNIHNAEIEKQNRLERKKAEAQRRATAQGEQLAEDHNEGPEIVGKVVAKPPKKKKNVKGRKKRR